MTKDSMWVTPPLSKPTSAPTPQKQNVLPWPTNQGDFFDKFTSNQPHYWDRGLGAGVASFFFCFSSTGRWWQRGRAATGWPEWWQWSGWRTHPRLRVLSFSQQALEVTPPVREKNHNFLTNGWWKMYLNSQMASTRKPNVETKSGNRFCFQCRSHLWILRGQDRISKKLEMFGSIVSRLASPRKILGENFFEHSGWHKTSKNA